MLLSRLFFTLSFLSLISLQSASDPKPDLVIEIFRHGARGPLNQTYDPNPDWGDAIEQLTPVGMRMHYLLGAALREQYKHLLEAYEPYEIYVRSTDVNRTIMSAYSHMYGVYGHDGPSLGTISAANAIPPYKSPLVQDMVQNLSNDYALPNNMQVVPVHIVPAAEDSILASYLACPKGVSWGNETLLDSESMSVFANDLNEVTAYLQSKGLQVETSRDLFLAGDNAIANVAQEKELPGSVDPSSQYYQDMKFAFEWYNTKMIAGLPQQVHLYPLDLLHAIANYTNGSITGSSELKFAFLSAHDTTLITLLSAFGTTTKDCLLANYRSQKQHKGTPYPHCLYPQFASNLIFEFYNTSEPYLKLFYDGVAIPFCGNSDNTCTYKRFVSYISEITNGYSSNNYREMCEFSDAVLTASVNKLKILVIVLGIICFVSISALIYVLVKRSVKGLNTEKGNGKWMSLPQEKEDQQPQQLFKNNTTGIELSNSNALRT